MSRLRLNSRALRAALASVLWIGLAITLDAAPPEWLVRCAALPTPDYAAGAAAVVLLDHESVRVDARGRRTATTRFAIRVLTAGGEAHAVAAITYIAGNDSVKNPGAWLLRAGKEFKLPRSMAREWIDVTADPSALVTDYRSKVFSFQEFASPGDVFGYEATVEGGMLFADQIRIWKAKLPTLVERYDLTLPSGWTLTERIDGLRALVGGKSDDGLNWRWELRDRPFRPEEPSVAEQWYDARLIAAIQRPADAPNKPASFARWSEMAAWNLNLNARQCDRDQALEETTKRLTSGLGDPLERIRAISRYVQQLRYVSTADKLGIGFGYRPRQATEVHAQGWGDCKDKANLMCAMLREVGVTAHIATASIGFGRLISPEWPSPYQFDHAIVAIPVDASVDLPAVVETAGLGRVLFFDATDWSTMLGDIPEVLQGSRVFVLAAGNDELTTLPILPVEQNRRLERRIEMALSSTGVVAGTGRFVGRGQAGAFLRGLLRAKSAKELEKWILESLGVPLRGALIDNVKVTDDPLTGDVQIGFDLAAPKFCQFLPGGLVLVKLDLFSRSGLPSFPKRERVSPVEFQGMQVHEQVTITLPDRFEAEELPSPVVSIDAFASYENRVELRDGVLELDRVLTLKDACVPAAEYGRVRQFVEGVAKADKGSAVLRLAAP